MMDHEQILQQIPDYVLGLLPSRAQRQVETHAQSCAHCRQALETEQQLHHLVRDTLQLATKPTPRQLRTLMPPIPQTQTPSLLWGWQKQLAPVMLLLLLLLGSLGWNASQQPNWSPNNPAFLMLTATSTNTPTVTATSGVTATTPPTQLPTSTAVAVSPAIEMITPAPNPTPLAAISYLSN